MMSLPVWSHVPSRGYDVTSSLVPRFFPGGLPPGGLPFEGRGSG